MKNKIPHYIESMRLRTLPLSVAGVLLGSLLAAADGYWKGDLFLFGLLTALSLQILSNIANELGDLEKGTDNEHRLGPIRSVQSGLLSRKELFNFLLLFVGLSALFGAVLVWLAFRSFFEIAPIVMLTMGALAILASIKYTFGSHSYGYVGLGDLFVFIFFGLVSVAGIYYLMCGLVPAELFLPASAVGLLSTAMLNQNNMRDVDNDKNFGKKTLAVRLGIHFSKIYHLLLILLAFTLMVIYAAGRPGTGWNYLFLITLPLFAGHLLFVFKKTGRDLDRQMKIISLSTILFALLAGVGFLING